MNVKLQRRYLPRELEKMEKLQPGEVVKHWRREDYLEVVTKPFSIDQRRVVAVRVLGSDPSFSYNEELWALDQISPLELLALQAD